MAFLLPLLKIVMSAALTEIITEQQQPPRNRASGQRLRVLHLINNFERGGTERQAVELLKGLDREQFDVRLAALECTGALYEEIAGLFPAVPEFPLTSFYDANALRQLRRLRSLLVSERIDILHAHDFYTSLFGSVAARLTRTRVIASQRHLRLSERRAHIWGDRLTHQIAHRVLVNSEAIRDQILATEFLSPRRIVVIRNGLIGGEELLALNHRAAHEALCRELGLGANAKLVGMVANLRPVKGHRFLIAAAARVVNSHPDVHFVLVGEGPLRTEIETQAAQLGIAEHVHLPGERSDAARLNAAFAVAVLSSLHEGLPNAVMEAMAAGAPVVASAVGGVRELVRDHETGYLAPPGDSEALAERISFALRNENLSAAVAARGRRYIATEYSLRRMIESVEALYAEMARESGAFQE